MIDIQMELKYHFKQKHTYIYNMKCLEEKWEYTEGWN